MSTKKKFITAYIVVGLMFAFYGWIWGVNSYKGFAYNLGTSILWPVMIFPVLGKIIGAIILIVVVAAVAML